MKAECCGGNSSVCVVSGGETSEDGVTAGDCQTAAAAVASAGQLGHHAVGPALGYYLVPPGYQSPYSSGV